MKILWSALLHRATIINYLKLLSCYLFQSIHYIFIFHALLPYYILLCCLLLRELTGKLRDESGNFVLHWEWSCEA